MDLKEALKILNIEDYEERILDSNSRGELHHIWQYFEIAALEMEMGWFREWFKAVIEYTQENWERPESVYQHIREFLIRDSNAKQTQDH